MQKPISYLYREIILAVVQAISEEDFDTTAEQKCATELTVLSKQLQHPLNFDETECKRIYNFLKESPLEEWYYDIKEEIRSGKVRTGLPSNGGGMYSAEAVAIPITGIPSLYIGWDCYFGGSDQLEPEKAEWMEYCYLLQAKDRVQTVRFYDKLTS
jgi:hypothetical protein